MDLKKFVYSDQLPYSSATYPRRKVVSGFGVGVLASFIVLFVIFFSVSSKVPLLDPVLQGFNSFSSSNSSKSSYLLYWSFSFSSTSCFSSSSCSSNASFVSEDTPNKLEYSVKGQNVSKNGESGNFVDSGGEGVVLGNAHVGNFSDNVKNGNISLLGGRVPEETFDKNGTFSSGNDQEMGSDDPMKKGNFVKKLRDEDITAGGSIIKSIEAEVEGPNATREVSDGDRDDIHADRNVGTVTDNVEQVGKEEKSPEVNDGKNAEIVAVPNSFYGDCDIFHGRWVRDDTKPYYPPGSCPYIDRDFDCYLNKRPDDEFLKWKWQPYGCDIPSLNATDFLERLRGQKLVFVGDSLNRNMWESLVCILRYSVSDKNRVYEITGRREFKKKGSYAFRFEDYNCSVDFVSSPFLVRESSFNGINGSFDTLRLDLMDKTASVYQDADVLIFNTGHWWTHEKTSRGEDYYQEGNVVHHKLKVLDAYKRALTTWARWVDKNIDANRTQVVFRGYSMTHFRGGPWNAGGQCHKEKEPIYNETYLAKYPPKMRALEYVLQEMSTPMIYLNISKLTDFRKDGHPSIYRKEYKTVEEQIAGEHTQDCSHWCLPGVPDTWNELLYASLLKTGQGSWRN